jgi:hypothetical protein
MAAFKYTYGPLFAEDRDVPKSWRWFPDTKVSLSPVLMLLPQGKLEMPPLPISLECWYASVPCTSVYICILPDGICSTGKWWWTIESYWINVQFYRNPWSLHRKVHGFLFRSQQIRWVGSEVMIPESKLDPVESLMECLGHLGHRLLFWRGAFHGATPG